MRQSAVNERDLSRKRWEDPGTVWLLALVGSLELARGRNWSLDITIEERATQSITSCHNVVCMYVVVSGSSLGNWGVLR